MIFCTVVSPRKRFSKELSSSRRASAPGARRAGRSPPPCPSPCRTAGRRRARPSKRRGSCSWWWCVVLLREDERSDGLAARPVLVEALRVDDPLRGHDFAMHAAHAHLDSVPAAPDESVGAADAEVDFADDEGPPGGSRQPALEKLGLRPAVEDQGRGASKSRVIRISRSLGVSTFSFPKFVMGTLLYFLPSLGSRFGRVALSSSSRASRRWKLLSSASIHFVAATRGWASSRRGRRCASRPRRDEAGALQHLQVLRDGGLAHPKGRREIRHRRLALRESGEDRAAGGVRESRERGIQRCGPGLCITS